MMHRRHGTHVPSRRTAGAVAALVFVLAGCAADEGPTGLSIDPSFSTGGDGGTPGEVILCKYTEAPTTSTFDFDVSATAGRVPGNGRFRLSATQTLDAGPECATVWTANGATGATITIQENLDAGWELYTVFDSDLGFFDAPAPNPYVVTVGATGSKVVVFKNRPAPIDMAPGRMTGGGRQFTIDDVSVTRGFTIHCDITLSNNVEINWAGYRWHLDKPLTSAICIDDPAVEPAPPPAPFDTFVGEGYGRLNNVDGSFLRFTFVDAGEPSGGGDRAAIQIWAPGADPLVDAPVLTVDGFLSGGNLQAHYDQPHR